MGEYSKIELLLLDKFTEAIDNFIQIAIYSQTDKDKLMYSSCVNDEEKEVFTKKEIKKMQKKLAKCNPDIAEFLRCYISPTEFDLSGDSYDQYRERLIRNFLSQEFDDVLEVLTMKFKKIEDVENVDELEWEEMIEEGHYGIDNKFMSHFIKYMAIADRLTTFKSILETVEEENKQQVKEKLTNPVMTYTHYQNDESTDVLIVEELEKRLAIEAVEYKRKLDDEWEKYTFDPMYFDNFISGDLYNEFLKSLYERIKPLNDFEINKYLTLSVNQFKTHTPEKRAEAFKRLYHDTYWFPNYMEYKEETYLSKYAMHVWKHYTNHFHLYKEATINALNDFKIGITTTTKKPSKELKKDFNSLIPQTNKQDYILQLLEDLSITLNGTSILTPRKKGALRGVIEALREKMIIPNIGLSTLCNVFADKINLELKSELDASTTSEKYKKEALQYIKNNPIH
ncbi:MAG: hypothetical protein CMC14_01060 [Flavobacteriaceae bacterium]|nr:hypothetical protein [Flavobacteriaceae bacterium]